MKASIVLCTIVVLFYWPVESRMCYDCFCDYNWAASTGSCASPNFESNCLLKDYGNQYCIIRSSYTSDNMEQRYFQAVAPDVYQDSHFFEATETISLSNSVWLPTTITTLSYGCDWDGCNSPAIAQYLPESFQMTINSTILNSQLIGEQSTLICELCTGCIDGITVTLCSTPSCTNGTCYIDEIHNYVATGPDDCVYYFSSVCQSPTIPAITPFVRIRAIYYIDLPLDRRLEIDEMDLACTKDVCNSLDTVEYLKGQIQTAINIPDGFQPTRPTNPPTDTTPGGIATTLKRSNVFLYFIFVLLLLLF